MENNLVKYSRAGDVFHYRWAARRCLRLINPRSTLRHIIIEGSKERTLAGEYVIDVAEYTESGDSGKEKVTYFQLKHSTKRVNRPFNLSDLKDTIEGFAERYKEHFGKSAKVQRYSSVTFTIVTNRSINYKFKKDVHLIGKSEAARKTIKKTLEKYTKLSGKNLQKFCSSLEFVDGEGNYNAQRHELHAEISELVAGVVDTVEVDSVVALVSDPDNWHSPIVCEDILKRFGCTSRDDLFPAPYEFETTKFTIKRVQHEYLLDKIIKATAPVIIHASGGVGKSILARQLANSLPSRSIGIVYDCFGSGKYRNRSRPRHRHRDALVQIANEMASRGLCEVLIPRSTNLDDAILRAFLSRLKMAAETLRKVDKEAIVAVFIDAADNAEMAAEEFNELCFANQILREPVPNGCRLIALCRTERVNLLKPTNVIQQLALENFSEDETLANLQRHFPDVTKADGREFYRLTGGNPRVQANALSISSNTISDILVSLGPAGSTVDQQISAQLESAISTVKEIFPADFQKHIEAICLCLANLPPLIPIDILAAAAEVDIPAVKSFVSDLGRPLMVSDNSVQFRDEPTETWFRKNYSASAQQIQSFLTNLKPFASKYPYVAEALPSLLLQSENFDELINLALSDDLLPENSPIDERNIRVYRLQFAFKAALKKKKYADAVKLAFRAGEEVAGDNRQLELLKKNIDLISPLQSEQRVQELAFRRLLCGAWDGSENVFSASLLSTVEDFKGDARAYLRAAENWLKLYFEERKKNREDTYIENLTDDDIAELAFTRFNLYGPKSLVKFILSWDPSEVIFRVSRLVIRRLVDSGNFAAINEIAQFGHSNQYLVIAIADELLAVGKYPPKDALTQSLNLLTHKRTRIPNSHQHSFDDKIIPAIVSFAEACAATGLSELKIQLILRHYVPQRASNLVSSEFNDRVRTFFLRGVALRTVLKGNAEPDIEALLPTELLKKNKDYRREQDVREFKEVVGGLLPWYVFRARILIGDKEDFDAVIEKANKFSISARTQRWREHDSIPYEITRVQFDMLALNKDSWSSEAEKLAKNLSDKDSQFWIKDRLHAVRAAFRLDHLSGIRDKFEQTCREIVDSASDEGPETKADWYINLARALLPVSRSEAAAYFNYAVEAVSKFGDEIVERWEAVVAMAKRCSEGNQVTPEIAYRFIRCAELVGDNVAREKYFNRNEAVRACAKLCPSSAFAALSRWRDRDIGWFERQLPALAYEVVDSKIISPSIGWSLSAFSWEYGFVDFAVLCIENESDHVCRKHILDTAVRDLRLSDNSETNWQKLESVAKRFSLINRDLDSIIAFQAKQIKTSETPIDQTSRIHSDDKSKNVDWIKILGDLDLSTDVGISKAIDRLNALPFPRDHEVFWEEVLRRVSDANASNFLQAIATAESTNIFDVQSALSCFPDTWRSKASVRRAWVSTLSSIARRFAAELINYHSLNYFIERIRAEDNLHSLQQGIMIGLSDSCDLVGASTFFGFVDIASPVITPEEATDLLEFSLSRFEEHINEDYADGPWATWLLPPKEVEKAFAGFVWSALGSPRSSIRWHAAHCVRRLAEMGCNQEIDALIDWMIRDSVDAFGSHKFPFYNLHATQYLLIALAHVAIDTPGILKSHYAVFAGIALSGKPHLLIQKYATEIALSIESAYPSTYEDDITERLRQVGISQMPPKEVQRYDEKFETPWHVRGEIDNTLKLHFGYDFDSYWFEPLGEVFGISGKQVEELAREVVLKDWNVKLDADFIHDPREKLWRRRHERETWHDHGSYPRTDDYSFYLSYHSMLTIATKLLQSMPFVQRRDSDEDEWQYWCRRHFLTRTDGRWLADRRDPVPLERRDWVQAKETETWRWEIMPDDFLDVLLITKEGKTWLNVCGWWNDYVDERVEKIYISSSIIPPGISNSILNALSTCQDSNNYKLPDYQEDRMEFDYPPFVLRGWIKRDNPDKGIDEFDPSGGDIDYPPLVIGDSFIERCRLSTNIEQREWHLPDSNKASLVCELWSSSRQPDDKDKPRKHGKRLSASLEFLKKFCSDLKCELVIKVEIDRQLHRSYYTRRDDEIGYQPPYCKIYILSADGTLRDERSNYQLR